MAFELGVDRFFEFLLRPFTSVWGWVLIAIVIIYIFLRLSGKINFKRDQGGPGGNTGGHDYET